MGFVARLAGECVSNSMIDGMAHERERVSNGIGVTGGGLIVSGVWLR
jgi:hypothetical protein